MTPELIIAGLALFITIIVNIVIISYFAGQLKANQEQQDKMIELLRREFNMNFERIEKKQDKHNNLIERVYINERDISVIKEQIKVENHRIEDLEENQNECIRKWS